MAGTLPEPFAGWFAGAGLDAAARTSSRCWRPRAAGESVLLIAPTGGGKTLAGFLPSLVELAEAPRAGLHTLYVSPLKALATDIARNLTRAGRRDAARRLDRDPHRRHAGQPPRAPAGRTRRTSC